ncbi:ABC transporter substrate-binding protein [Archaeoglobus profundus]|uniref:Extracellular ligand-binding receptor n=1 Tax=Archaeoglobus profundus (strain DSM 5631 / JCM 9629 / NBRC 100127 / Av18) TaxID=572546 RepID=D2RFJ3_ARCPA|nr:ABC transporter substrate-binding protein [Archaeoglobus profundus]ADB58887.1 Extracellular ligand-binding receptor [Archaeoglobus profundus DSM 5631]
MKRAFCVAMVALLLLTPTVLAKDAIIIGFTMSQTGKYNSESKEQYQGLKLWADDVNAQGGIYVKSLDKKLPVKLVFYDDESSKDRVQQLYAKLITEDNADFLISPYSSGLTASAAIIAEQYGKIMIATGAASDSIFNKGYKHIFQVYTPASRYLTGAIDMLKAADPNAKRVAIVYENSKFAKDVCTAVKEYAEENGFDVVLFEPYSSGTTDFTSFINKILASNPDAIIGGGHFADGENFAKQLYEKRVKVKLISLLVAPAVPEFAEIGDAALYVTGPSQWEPQAKYSKEIAEKLGVEWYGPTVEQFVEQYKSAYGYEPGYHAAGGYVAGLILQKAIEDAGTLDTEKVKEALEKMDIMTFYGRISFDTGEYYGRQKGHEMVYLQWQKKNGELIKEVVWPEEAKSADLVYPLYIKFEEGPTEAGTEVVETTVTEKTPGFELVFAVAGLCATYILRRKVI